MAIDPTRQIMERAKLETRERGRPPMRHSLLARRSTHDWATRSPRNEERAFDKG